MHRALSRSRRSRPTGRCCRRREKVSVLRFNPPCRTGQDAFVDNVHDLTLAEAGHSLPSFVCLVLAGMRGSKRRRWPSVHSAARSGAGLDGAGAGAARPEHPHPSPHPLHRPGSPGLRADRQALRQAPPPPLRGGQPLAATCHRFPAADANLLAVAGRTPSSRFDVVTATCCAARSLLRLQAGQAIRGLPARRDEAPPALRLIPARPSASLGPCDPLPRHLGALDTKTGDILPLEPAGSPTAPG